MGKAVSRCITVTTVIDGENGTNGYNTAVVQLFRRYTPTQEAPTPALPNGALTYTFSTGKLTGSYFNGWSQDMPSAASGGKLFITMATARSTEATDSIAANEWATPVEYVTDGPKGEPGISQAPVIIYKRYATQPDNSDRPANGCVYTFATGVLSGELNGWSTKIPSGTNPCWVRQAVALGSGASDTIDASEWSGDANGKAEKLVEDGVSITSADIVFCLSDDGTTEPADSSSWATTFADLITSTSASKYVWQATKMELSNSSTPRYTGKQCLGKVSDFASVTEQFALGTASAVTGSWQDNTPPPPSKGSYLWTRTKLTFKDNHSTYTTPQCVGYYAKDNVEYKISLAGSVLAHDPNTGKLIVSIVGRVHKVEGDTTTTYAALTKSNLYLYFENANGNSYQVPEEDISVSKGQFTTTYKNGANYNNEVLFGVRFNINNAIKARESIQVVKYGTNGQSITGHTGRFFYYAGEYNGVPGSYAMQETQGPYVKMRETGEFWMLDFKGVEPTSFPAAGVPATEAPSDQSTQWTKMSSQQQYYIARAFFGPYANLGSFIINNDWMISQFGVLVDSSGTKTIVNANNVDTLFNGKVPYAWFEPTDPLANTAPSSGQYKFAPNFAVDGLAGKTYQNDAFIRGEVHASSGAIGGFEIGQTTIKSSNGNIVLNSDGSATFKNGDFEVTSGNNSIKINSDGFEAKWGSEGLKVGASGIQRWDSTRNVWAPMYEKKIAKVFKTTTIDLGSAENKSVNYVLNARVDWDNRTTVYLPSSSDVPNGASIVVRGLARDCDANVSPKQGSNDVILAGDYIRSSMEVLAADCAEFIMCKGIDTYIRATQYEQNPSVYVKDAWLCNMYDRDL